MKEHLFARRPVFLLGAFSFLGLLILSVVFYKERVGFADLVYHLFTILETKTFFIQNNRFVAGLTQVFPIVGAKLHLSLREVAMVYSAGFVFVQFLVFWCINNGLKKPRVAMAYLLFATLMTTHTFFWVQSELPQGMAFLFVYLAILENIVKGTSERKTFLYIVNLLLMGVLAYAHPLIIFPFVFCHAFYFVQYKEKRKLLLAAVGIYVIIAVSRSFIFAASYEQSAFGGLKNFIYLFPNYFSIQSNKNFARYLMFDYYFLVAIFCMNCYYYFKHQHFYKLIISAGFFIGLAALINISYAGGAFQFYLENQYLLLSIFVIIPFLWDVLPYTQFYKHQYLICGILVLACFLRIWLTTPFYTEQLNWKRGAIHNMQHLKEKRVLLKESEIPRHAYFHTWSVPYEFWFLSTLEYGYSQAVIVEEKPTEKDWTWDHYDEFISDMEVTDYAQLLPPYFLYPTSTPLERFEIVTPE